MLRREGAFFDCIQYKTSFQRWSKQRTERSMKIGVGHRLPMHGKANFCIRCQIPVRAGSAAARHQPVVSNACGNVNQGPLIPQFEGLRHLDLGS